MTYVDGFLLPIPADKKDEYRKMAETAGKIWIEHGALSYKECIGDDVAIPDMVQFPKVIGANDNEVTVFAFIVFKSREHRDEVNAIVMADPRLKMEIQDMPFDMKRMAYGGFKTVVDF